jgi:hypothetical protein
MMTTVYIDPIHGAALTAGLLPILPGLPCPTCRGTGWRCRNSNLMCTHRVHQGCEDCTGSGVWTPPDHPVTIGVTSATADAMLDQDERMHEAGYDIGIIGDQRSGWELATRPPGEEWTSGNTIKHPIVLSSVIGEGTLRKLKVEATDWENVRSWPAAHRQGDTLTYWPSADTRSCRADISSALPFLPGLKPEDTVYLLDGFTESVECPEWHDSTPEDVINEVERRLRDEEWSSQASDRCRTALLHIDAYREGKARSQSVGRLSCPFPVDAPDHPCVSEPQDQR